jgi:hypothetical protein
VGCLRSSGPFEAAAHSVGHQAVSEDPGDILKRAFVEARLVLPVLDLFAMGGGTGLNLPRCTPRLHAEVDAGQRPPSSFWGPSEKEAQPSRIGSPDPLAATAQPDRTAYRSGRLRAS